MFFSFYQFESYFYFNQVNQIVIFLNLYSTSFNEFFNLNHSKKFFVMFLFKTVNSQTLNAILIKSNYQKIRQKVDFFLSRRVFSIITALQKCCNSWKNAFCVFYWFHDDRRFDLSEYQFDAFFSRSIFADAHDLSN